MKLIIKITAAALLGLLVGLLYFHYNYRHLSRFIDRNSDSNTYAWYITETFQNTLSKEGEARIIYNPHHLFFDAAGQFLVSHIYGPVPKNKYRSVTLYLLRLRNLTAASLSLALVFFFSALAFNHLVMALALILWMGFSKGFWIYAQMNDTPLIHSALAAVLAGWLLVMPSFKGSRLLWAAGAGVLHYLAVMFHQSNMLLGLPVVLFFLSRELLILRQQSSLACMQQSVVNFLVPVGVYLALFGGLTAFSYGYVADSKLHLDMSVPQQGKKYQSLNQIKNSHNFYYWIFLYSNIPSRKDKTKTAWGNGLDQPAAGIARSGLTGFSESLLHPAGAHPVDPGAGGDRGDNKELIAAHADQIKYTYSQAAVADGVLGDDQLLKAALAVLLSGIAAGLLAMFLFIWRLSSWSFRQRPVATETFFSPSLSHSTSAFVRRTEPVSRLEWRAGRYAGWIYLFTWMAIYTLFALWWESDYYEFWVNPFLAILFTAFFGLDLLTRQFSGLKATALRLSVSAWLVVSGLLIAAANWSRFIQFFASNL